MTKSKNVPRRVELVWPPTGANATPLSSDADKWIKQGWKPVNTTKDTENGDE